MRYFIYQNSGPHNSFRDDKVLSSRNYRHDLEGKKRRKKKKLENNSNVKSTIENNTGIENQKPNELPS
jgi:hypothetical protein